MTIKLGNTPVTLLPAHAVFLEKSAVLIVSDMHLGKSATFRSRGIPVPEGDTQGDLNALSFLIEKHSPKHLIIAGDLVHAKDGMSLHVMEIFRTWAASLTIPMILTEGNHDRMARLLEHTLPIEIVPFIEIDGLHITHDPNELPKNIPGIAGHFHPGIRIPESSRHSVRTPFFCLRHQQHLILPAFSRFTGMNIIELEHEDRVFVPIKERVLEIPQPRKSATTRSGTITPDPRRTGCA